MEYIKLILVALGSVATLFVIAKIMGHKELSQLDFFDYITGITIGSIAAEMATEPEKPLRPLIAMVIYGIVSVLLRVITSHFAKARKFINGAPSIIMQDGTLYRSNLKKSKIDLSDFMVMCRQQGYFDLKDIQTAVFEYNGKLTILPKSGKRPATPDDLELSPPPAHIQTELIMDGRILSENLKRMATDEHWLMGQLKVQGYTSAKEIFLATCDEQKNVTLYPMKTA